MSDHGRWIWYELITPDVPGAKRFYGDLLGWTAQDLPAAPGSEPYAIVSADGYGLGGIMNLGEAMKAEGMPPNWTGYICVDDCDAAAARAKTLGGGVMREPMDIPGIGRFAVLTDPAGAVLIVMKPTPPPGGRPEAPKGGLGLVSWHELYGAHPDEGFDFYAGMFGWTKTQDFDMGPGVGKYQLFANQDGEVGAMMQKPAEVPAPPGTSTSAWATSARRPPAPRPAAPRSCWSRWRCPAATGCSRASTRRARSSPPRA